MTVFFFSGGSAQIVKSENGGGGGGMRSIETGGEGGVRVSAATNLKINPDAQRRGGRGGRSRSPCDEGL